MFNRSNGHVSLILAMVMSIQSACGHVSLILAMVMSIQSAYGHVSLILPMVMSIHRPALPSSCQSRVPQPRGHLPPPWAIFHRPALPCSCPGTVPQPRGHLPPPCPAFPLPKLASANQVSTHTYTALPSSFPGSLLTSTTQAIAPTCPGRVPQPR